jgi:hypothetical protein
MRVGYSGTSNRKGRPHANPTFTTAQLPKTTEVPGPSERPGVWAERRGGRTTRQR